MAQGLDRPEEAEIVAVLAQARREVSYIVTDFSLELITSKFREDPKEEGDIYIPEYQRKLAWNREQQSYFIESLLLRVPVPPVFLYDVEGRLEIVDGSQRIRCASSFVGDEFALSGLEKLEILNGLSFKQLPTQVQRRLLNTPIRSFILDQGTEESTRIELFRRLNTSGKKLQDAEIRKGAFRGPFLDLVISCASSSLFQKLTPRIGGGVDPESERQELVTRFFIFLNKYGDFKHDVRSFLDKQTQNFNKTLDQKQISRMRNEFDKVTHYIFRGMPHAFYKTPKSRRLPRIRFEAISVGTALALRSRPDLEVQRHAAWLESNEFLSLVRAEATNSGPKLRNRVLFVRDALLRR